MPIQRILDIYSNRNRKLPSKIIQNSFSMKIPSRRACHLNPLTTKESHISNVFINQILAMALLKVNSSSCRRYRNLFFNLAANNYCKGLNSSIQTDYTKNDIQRLLELEQEEKHRRPNTR